MDTFRRPQTPEPYFQDNSRIADEPRNLNTRPKSVRPTSIQAHRQQAVVTENFAGSMESLLVRYDCAAAASSHRSCAGYVSRHADPFTGTARLKCSEFSKADSCSR